MIENTRSIDIASNVVLILGVLFILTPLYFVMTTATHSFEYVLQNGMPLYPGTHLLDNIKYVFNHTRIPSQIINSLCLALTVALGKCLFAYITAFALVFFNLRFSGIIFALVLVTIMLPLDVRVVTTYEVASNVLAPLNWLFRITGMEAFYHNATGLTLQLKLSLLNTYLGLAIPLIAHGTGTFMFRQFFKTIPKELPEAARMDGAGPLRFAIDILMPISKSSFAALFILMFLGGWSAYLWPLVASSTPEMQTAVVGLAKLQPSSDGEIANYPVIMTAVLMISCIPLIMIALLQKHMVKGLALSEK
ncbi:ABC transporter permease subunit [Serratia entomophila]|uniref:ABC transporter permease subunit n=1 Tax=Serratia entomophila TaxID=42906 RepID=UPI002177E06A|nr:ABC transporter permease subunit [Serratia entomophila]CAI1057952.1 Inner membrane ABC transporter permease protein ycjP [Serratia entomophila]CAI1790241.1 Inner membrane ABC transporter permease protein ycjP [Serratia entomophila]CAI1830210.1 Inner membrane ABC transporter permease protein ycjP [Serratia entomophila]CAI1844076.1 Inner membrane ABC transporter permease protein ycjP [Serratia entomophila]CAI1914102.1 Inner membrane ABC transporter permease protein ycjP [Serratia entomophila]